MTNTVFDVELSGSASLDETLNRIHDRYEQILRDHQHQGERSMLRKGLIRGIVRSLGREWLEVKLHQHRVGRELELTEILFDSEKGNPDVSQHLQSGSRRQRV